MTATSKLPASCLGCPHPIRSTRPFFQVLGGLHAHAACAERLGLVDHIEQPARAKARGARGRKPTR